MRKKTHMMIFLATTLSMILISKFLTASNGLSPHILSKTWTKCARPRWVTANHSGTIFARRISRLLPRIRVALNDELLVLQF